MLGRGQSIREGDRGSGFTLWGVLLWLGCLLSAVNSGDVMNPWELFSRGRRGRPESLGNLLRYRFVPSRGTVSPLSSQAQQTLVVQRPPVEKQGTERAIFKPLLTPSVPHLAAFLENSPGITKPQGCQQRQEMRLLPLMSSLMLKELGKQFQAPHPRSYPTVECSFSQEVVYE